MDATELQQIYLTALRDIEEFTAEIDDDGGILLTSEEYGVMFFILDAESDPEFMMLIYPSFADMELLGLTREQLLRAINNVNGTSKAVKLYIPPEYMDEKCDVNAGIECFLAGSNAPPNVDLLRAILVRNISAIFDSVRNLVSEAEKLKRNG